jgi:hypothetical protein
MKPYNNYNSYMKKHVSLLFIIINILSLFLFLTSCSKKYGSSLNNIDLTCNKKVKYHNIEADRADSSKMIELKEGYNYSYDDIHNTNVKGGNSS